MKFGLIFLFASTITMGFCQGHDLKPAEALQKIAFLQGDWKGKQNFVTEGAPMIGDAVDHIRYAIGGRYFEETLSTTLPGRDASDTRHFLTFDPKANLYKAWWFNDSSVGAMELQGTLEGKKLILMSKPNAPNIFKATYENVSAKELIFMLELKTGNTWRQLFRTTYRKD